VPVVVPETQSANNPQGPPTVMKTITKPLPQLGNVLLTPPGGGVMTSPPPTIEHLHPFTTPTLVPSKVLSSAHTQSESSRRGTNRGRTPELPPVRDTMAAPSVVVTIAETTATIPPIVITTAETATPVEPTIHHNMPTSSTNAPDYEIPSPEIAGVQAEMLMCKSKIETSSRGGNEENDRRTGG
jgi:hypothetical protein